ncbi:MAG: HMG-box domain-containing protein [Halieaceae bacterium]|nr:HMG-box domain-containing protein [Halieaceae bacterium]
MPSLASIRKAASYQLRKGLRGHQEPMRRIFASGGGHGSVHLISALRPTLCSIHVRPDTAFDVGVSLDDRPDNTQQKAFEEKTGYRLDPGSSINDNMVAYLEHVRRSRVIVLLSRLSRLGDFFARNAISDPICLVRHPLHAYISFVGHRHPKVAEELGAIDSEERIRWYAEQWSAMTEDYLSAGCKIIRFEFMHDDVAGIRNPDLSYLLRDWRTGTRNNGVLSSEREAFLHDLVKATYDRIYDDWSI